MQRSPGIFQLGETKADRRIKHPLNQALTLKDQAIVQRRLIHQHRLLRRPWIACRQRRHRVFPGIRVGEDPLAFRAQQIANKPPRLAGVLAIFEHRDVGRRHRRLRKIDKGKVRIVQQQIGIVINHRTGYAQPAFDLVRHAKAAG